MFVCFVRLHRCSSCLLLAAFLSLAFVLCGRVTAAPTLDLSAGPRQLVNAAEYLRTDSHLTLAQLREREFTPFSPDQTNQGISKAYHWLHFSLTNPGTEPATWVLRGETTYLDSLTLYVRQHDAAEFKVHELSDRAVFTSRPLGYRTLSFPGTTAVGASTEIYLLAHNQKADSVSLRFTLHSAADFANLVRKENLLLGAFYGALTLMIFLALVVGILMRQPNAFKYAIFLATTLSLWLMLNGLGFQYLWPRQVWWHNEGFHIVYLLFVWSGLEFSKSFLQLKSLAPRWHTLFTVVQMLALFGIILRGLGIYEAVLHLAFLLMASIGLLIIAASWVVYRRGQQYALWSLIAWVLYSTGLQLSLLSAYTSKLQWGMDALFFTQAGSLLETLFLMVAMAKWLVEMDTDRKLAHAMAQEDALTGLGNRRRLQTAFQRVASEAMNNASVFLIMIDIDRFKQINDKFGHDAGDSVLRSVGALLRRVCRKGDLAVRFGGEEFALVVHAEDADTAWRIAERIRTEFAQQPTRYDEFTIHHTLCCGVAEIHSAAVKLTGREMMQRADAALYHAKAAGRNQCHLFDPSAQLAPAALPAGAD